MSHFNKKMGALALSVMLMLALLSGCAASGLTGTWFLEGDVAAFQMNFEKDNTLQYYDPENDEVGVGSWSKAGDNYTISIDGEDDFAVNMDGKDAFTLEDLDATFIKGKATAIPAVTEGELYYNTWESEDGAYELCFYSDGTWDIEDLDAGDYLMEGTYSIEAGKGTMETQDGKKFEPTLSTDRQTLTLSKEYIFIIQE